MKWIKIALFSLSIFAISIQANAQTIFNGKDLSPIKVDALTDVELSQIQAQIKKSGVSIDMLESQALAKGMNPAEFAKLKAKLKGAKTGVEITTPLTKKDSEGKFINPLVDSIKPVNKINPLIYGSELFSNESGFGENKNIPTPLNYEIGTNDVLKLVVYGVQEYSTDLEVSKEGSVMIDNVGRVKVAGLTIEAATTRIKQQMANTAYSSLRTGESKLALTVGDTRTIQVTIIGAQRSGNFNVSSLSTILNALTIAGGPNDIGSYRNIELIRNNKLFKKIDLYAFMQNGDQSQNMGLKDRDVIRVPAYKGRIEIKGQVKRPGIFEINGSAENFNQFIQYAGGFDDVAYTAWVKVIQKNDKEKVVKDLSAKEFASYQPQGGDIIQITKILDRFQNRVKLSGAVFRPDVYELTEGMRISDLIQKADGLKEDAYLGRAQLIRLKPNLLKELVSINLGKAIQKGSEENIYLQREDELYINSIVDLRDSLTIDLLGEVRSEGRFNYVDSMTVKDLILMAGGFKYEASKQVEVARLIQRDEAANDNKFATILKTEINGDLSFNPGQENFILQPMDVVTITKKIGYNKPEVVRIAGQVQSEGLYSLSSRLDRVSDLISRSGGLVFNAYTKGAYIIRKSILYDTLSSKVKDSFLLNKIAFENPSNIQRISLDIDAILKKPAGPEDIVLRDEDEVVIPKLDNKVVIRGGVLRPVTISFKDGLTLSECISAAGGVTEISRRNKAYVVYNNGRAKRTKSFGFFRFNPKIEPGSEVVLPEGEKRKDALTSLLQYVTILAQIGTSVATLTLLSR
jgi:protein involved in polysaccharide export with SLBB domain